jgi:hypothetical protein
MLPDDWLLKLIGTPAQTSVLEKLKAAVGQLPDVVFFITCGIVSVNGGEAFRRLLVESSKKKKTNNLYFIKMRLYYF